LSQTGNRAFWLLKTGKINIAALKHDREQLLGEAATYEAAGESIMLNESLWGAAREAQELRRVKDPWEDALVNIPENLIRKSGDGNERVASADVLRIALDIPLAQQTPAHGQRLVLAMKNIGWKRNESGLVKIDGNSVRGYFRQTAASDAGGETQPHIERSLVRFLNHHLGSGHFVYTDRTWTGSPDCIIQVLVNPLTGRPVYVHVARDERKILISRCRRRGPAGPPWHRRILPAPPSSGRSGCVLFVENHKTPGAPKQGWIRKRKEKANANRFAFVVNAKTIHSTNTNLLITVAARPVGSSAPRYAQPLPGTPYPPTQVPPYPTLPAAAS
jgi:hypothetical protein